MIADALEQHDDNCDASARWRWCASDMHIVGLGEGWPAFATQSSRGRAIDRAAAEIGKAAETRRLIGR